MTGMFEILSKEALNPTVVRIAVSAPRIARKAEPGQFVILRAKEQSERIPLTVADYDREAGTVTVIYQIVGAGTMELNTLNAGDCLHDLVGPLGTPTRTEGLKKVCIVGGGVGAAPLFMFTEQLVREGREVEVVLGAQTASMMVTRDDYASLLGRDPIVATDDGSLGYAGFCTEPVREELARGDYSAVYCCGPTPLMRAVAAIAEEAGVPCWVSMEKRMACGVGACLSCVVETQAGKRRSCVDGPVFDAEKVVW